MWKDKVEAIMINSLTLKYGYEQAQVIIKIYLEDKVFDSSDQRMLHEEITSDLTHLMNDMPIQYITGKAYFYDQFFKVDKSTLIPRPETEELVYNIITQYKEKNHVSILDIGTGSGCIAIILKKHMPSSFVDAIDISSPALDVARSNAETSGAKVNFYKIDILNEYQWLSLSKYDIIVSNPPYVDPSESHLMSHSVIRHEPLTALFPPNNDTLVFYRTIAERGSKHLNEGGCIFSEMNEFKSQATVKLFESKGYKTQVFQDLQGKERILKAWLK